MGPNTYSGWATVYAERETLQIIGPSLSICSFVNSLEYRLQNYIAYDKCLQGIQFDYS